MADEPAAAERVLRRSYGLLKNLRGTGQLHPVIILLNASWESVRVSVDDGRVDS
jgi:hypothetical protein